MQPEAISVAPEAVSAYVALAMAAGALVTTVWKVAWGSQQEQIERDRRIAELAAEIHEEIERSERMTGESMAAIREKITQVELWNRDNLSRRAEVSDALTAMRNEMQSLTARIDHKLDDIGRKIDEVRSRPLDSWRTSK